jgi:hypothetical protein
MIQVLSRHKTMLIITALTVFVSASLLFVVQPMVGKMILPHLGGSSSVWTTCMLFFQTVLLLGYIYAHGIAQWMTLERQVAVHLGIMVMAALASLPLAVPEAWLQVEGSPAGWLLVALTIGIGLPLFVVSSSAPLFQHWFSKTDHPDAEDPYHLYAASNVGSMVALLAYPFVIEPSVGLSIQSWGWTFGFVALIGMTGATGALVLRRKSVDDAEASTPTTSAEALSWKRRGLWVLWAFIPSSLMLGVTQFLTTDIASVPLLWVLPLALYLFSFILVFSRWEVRVGGPMRTALPLAVLVVLDLSVSDASMSVIIAAQLLLFALLATHYHGELADDRPAPAHLTEYFIWMSVGGAAGGLFNSLIAPAVFDRPLEYMLVLALAAAFMHPNPRRIEDDLLPSWPVPVLLVPAGLLFLWMIHYLRLGYWVPMAVSVATVGIGCLIGVRWPRWENVAVGAVILLGMSSLQHTPGVLEYERSFFASYTVFARQEHGRTFVKFSHGTTSHGVQSREEELEETPLAYHHPAGPVGDVIEAIPHEDVGVLGLGAGAMAAYAEPGTQFTFYEIDPGVEAIARKHFTYLEQCGELCTVKIGDGRQLLEETPPDTYDILFLDAYNSDSVPTHLMTREALDLYLSRVDEDGVLVFNVSNRYLDIQGLVGALAEDAGLVSLTRFHYPRRELRNRNVYTSVYTAVARNRDDLRSLADSEAWKPTESNGVVWTDSYSDVVSILDW